MNERLRKRLDFAEVKEYGQCHGEFFLIEYLYICVKMVEGYNTFNSQSIFQFLL